MLATIWFQMPQIRKEMPWNHFEIIRTNKFVDRFQLIGLFVYVFLSCECAPPLDRLIGTRHGTVTWHVLRNKSSKCYRKLHTFIRFTRFSHKIHQQLSGCVLSFFVFLKLLFFYAVQFGFVVHERGRQALLADWLFRLIAFYMKKQRQR